MNYLVTGGTGFLGRYIIDFLEKEGHKVMVATRNPRAANHIEASSLFTVPEHSFDYVIHAAGKAHIVPKTKEERQSFYDVNVSGTGILLAKLSELPVLPKGIVFISSVAVYGKNTGTEIIEQTPLAATDPYGKSKIEAENIILDWGKKLDVVIGIARLPIIAGKNAPGNLNAMIKGIKSGRYFRIGNGKARKSMVWAGDVASILPVLAAKGGIYNFTDGCHPSFAGLEDAITKELHLKSVKKIPLFLAKFAAMAGTFFEMVSGKKMPINSRILQKIVMPLTFSDQKAREVLNWNPSPVLSHIKEITE